MRQMIKGTDITLYSGSDTETVSNVLIGGFAGAQSAVLAESGKAPQAYTLAIPKGDTHEWTDRIVEFFDSKFRTLGYPEQGIEDNIPLFWHKLVRVQEMSVNGNCAIYGKDTFTRHSFTDVYIFDNSGTKTAKDGVNAAGAFTVHIYADRERGDGYKPQLGDIVVMQTCEFEFDTTSEQTTSESMATFRAEYSGMYAVVNDVQSITYGTLPDYIITAR